MNLLTHLFSSKVNKAFPEEYLQNMFNDAWPTLAQAKRRARLLDTRPTHPYTTPMIPYDIIRTFANKLFGTTPPKPSTYLIIDRRVDKLIFGAVTPSYAPCRYVSRTEFYETLRAVEKYTFDVNVDNTRLVLTLK